MIRIHSGQLGFDDLLSSADADNRARKFAGATAHLPGTMDEALPHYGLLLRKHHAAMFNARVDEVMRLRGEARNLALKLNGGDPGILAGENAPGYVLMRKTGSVSGSVPLWGQSGEFVVTVCGMRIRVELDGIFGIGADIRHGGNQAYYTVGADRIQMPPFEAFRDDHSAYIASWLKVPRDDKRAIFTAAAHAQRAVDFLHSL